jgi:inner membrane protein
MRNRTHLAVTLFFVLILFPVMNNKIIFSFVALIATLLPDIDTRFSYLGKRKIFRPLQVFLRHRGFFHSGTFLFFGMIILYFFQQIFIFPFFIGYAMHLFLDCFTPTGIRIFYPLKLKLRGSINTGGKRDFFIFILFSVFNFFILIFLLVEKINNFF